MTNLRDVLAEIFESGMVEAEEQVVISGKSNTIKVSVEDDGEVVIRVKNQMVEEKKEPKWREYRFDRDKLVKEHTWLFEEFVFSRYDNLFYLKNPNNFANRNPFKMAQYIIRAFYRGELSRDELFKVLQEFVEKFETASRRYRYFHPEYCQYAFDLGCDIDNMMRHGLNRDELYRIYEYLDDIDYAIKEPNFTVASPLLNDVFRGLLSKALLYDLVENNVDFPITRGKLNEVNKSVESAFDLWKFKKLLVDQVYNVKGTKIFKDVNYAD